MSSEKKGVRNYRISVTQGMSGHFAVMIADYEDMDWGTDIVTTGIGRYQTMKEAEDEGRLWAAEEEIPFLSVKDPNVFSDSQQPQSSTDKAQRSIQVSENLITPNFRAAFISVFRATSMKNADGSASKAKYSIRAAFPPTADLAPLKKEAEMAAREKWGDKIPKTLRSPFRLNEELENPVVGIGDDWVIMSFSANEDRRPGVVDAKLQDIIDDTDIYSGAWYRAQVRAFAYENAGNKGVSFGLQNVQKLRDDDPLGNGRIPASKAFEPVDVPNGSGNTKTATSIFG